MRENFRLVSGRRAIGLGRRPLLQLKLPLILLAITVSFGALFAAHTWAAWGQLISFGASEPWVGQLADEILRDYLTVSTAIATAYVAFLMLTCLAYTHRLLGPIVALNPLNITLKKPFRLFLAYHFDIFSLRKKSIF